MWIVGGGIALVVLWLLLGRRIVLVLDTIFPGKPSANDYDPRLLNVDYFALGKRLWPLEGLTFRLILDSRQRLVFYAGGRAFTFGPVKEMWTDPVKPQYLFVEDAGDVVTFTREVSRFAWHTPFAFHIMGVYMAKRHRYVYHRLRWIKKSGAKFEITWRDEQRFDGRSKTWSDQYNYRLADFRIAVSEEEKIAAAYLKKVRKWAPTDYRLEFQEDYVIHAIHHDDERARHPGRGKSVVLHVDKLSGKISETAFQ